MAKERAITEAATKALIYCRVSSVKQRVDGAGLQSQEQRCRKFAEERGLDVEMVFPDDVSGGGDFMQRPGMCAMLVSLTSRCALPSGSSHASFPSSRILLMNKECQGWLAS